MNFNLEKNFPTFTNNKEKIKSGQSRLDFLKSLGKKAVPYIAAMTALLASPTFSKAQDKVKDNSNTVWTIKSPDGKQTKTFNTKEERDAFARARNLNISSEKSTERKDTTVKADSQGGKVEWKLTSPDGKQTKTFNTKEERDAFARAHKLNIPLENTGNQKNEPTQKADLNSEKVEWKLVSPDGKQTKTFNTKEERDAFAKEHRISLPGTSNSNKVEQKISKTDDYQNLIENAPNGKSKIIQINSNNNAKIYKVKKEGKKIKIKEEGDVKVIRTQD